jgi:hypothetical protein
MLELAVAQKRLEDL